jgi:hypothetical protein
MTAPETTPTPFIRCAVRQLLRWRVEGNRGAIGVMQRRSRIYAMLKPLAEQQWALGNRGETGDWR